eukprot:TRINITY_DN11607_c0_g1_i1.p1 TRINITY_DN11607_c0_g1~~TRINITY_DN11607_c0_g1_i1.p1  ORF type:complete len:175 (-),score=7.49 TRINITY_DN11607_c0_g1_i1:6-530(-)
MTEQISELTFNEDTRGPRRKMGTMRAGNTNTSWEDTYSNISGGRGRQEATGDKSSSEERTHTTRWEAEMDDGRCRKREDATDQERPENRQKPCKMTRYTCVVKSREQRGTAGATGAHSQRERKTEMLFDEQHYISRRCHTLPPPSSATTPRHDRDHRIGRPTTTHVPSDIVKLM